MQKYIESNKEPARRSKRENEVLTYQERWGGRHDDGKHRKTRTKGLHISHLDASQVKHTHTVGYIRKNANESRRPRGRRKIEYCRWHLGTPTQLTQKTTT